MCFPLQRSQLLMLTNRIREFTDKKANLEAEIGQDLQSQLTGDEQRQMQRLQVCGL